MSQGPAAPSRILLGSLISLVAAYAAVRSFHLATTDCDLVLRDADARRGKSTLRRFWQGKRVWITGASSGIGRELAKQCASYGARVLLTSRRREALEKVRDELDRPERHPIDEPFHEILVLDLSRLEDIPAAVEQAFALMGGIDVLVNNAGVSQRSLARDTMFTVDQSIMTLDYFATALLTKHVLRLWDALDETAPPVGSRHIVNVSSLAGKIGSPLRTAYCAAKFAVIGFMNSLRLELAGTPGNNIHITNVCPGSVATDVSINALVGNGSTFAAMDENIAKGMSVERCALLMLVAITHKIPEVWMFGGRLEKIGAYLAQYAPGLFHASTLSRATQMHEQYSKVILESKKV